MAMVPKRGSISPSLRSSGYRELCDRGYHRHGGSLQQTTTIAITPSDSDYLTGTAVVRQELWYAPGYNVVRFEEEIINGAGQVVEPWRQWRIYDASVSGVMLSEHLLDARRVVVELDHKSLVYDPVRQRYIASLAPSAGGGLAVVSATSGAVLQTTTLAGEPGPMLFSPNGDALYVGLDTTGELLKLDPVTLAVQARVAIGGTRVLHMATSPVDPNRLALSVTNDCLGCGGSDARLVLVDSMVLAPGVSSTFGYSFPIFAFDPSGAQIYSFNNQSTKAEFVVHDVTATGVQLNRWVTDDFAGGSAMWVDGSHLIVDRSTYSLPDLSFQRTVPSSVGHCTRVRPGRAVCLDSTREAAVYGLDVSRLVLMDTATGQALARPSFANVFMKSPLTTTGAPGQLAISVKDHSFERTYPQIWLYQSDDLLK